MAGKIGGDIASGCGHIGPLRSPLPHDAGPDGNTSAGKQLEPAEANDPTKRPTGETGETSATVAQVWSDSGEPG